MSNLFNYSSFNGDISKWDTSNVTNMNRMFIYSSFNGDISGWDVSNVIDMGSMFEDSKFNSDISDWDVSNVHDMEYMFYKTSFNKDISSWNVSKVGNMYAMFYGSKFDKDISSWDVRNVREKASIFYSCPIRDEYKPKFDVKESFDFDNINKKKNTVNGYDIVLNNITNKIANEQNITKEDYDILTSFIAVYKVKDGDELTDIVEYFIR
jgi:surface protein